MSLCLFSHGRVSIVRCSVDPIASRKSLATYHLHEQAAGLADTTRGAQDGDFVPARLLHRSGGGA